MKLKNNLTFNLLTVLCLTFFGGKLVTLLAGIILLFSFDDFVEVALKNPGMGANYSVWAVFWCCMLDTLAGVQRLYVQ